MQNKIKVTVASPPKAHPDTKADGRRRFSDAAINMAHLLILLRQIGNRLNAEDIHGGLPPRFPFLLDTPMTAEQSPPMEQSPLPEKKRKIVGISPTVRRKVTRRRGGEPAKPA